jgi:hypothetical protein
MSIALRQPDRTTLWVAVTAAVSLLIPGAGFVVAGVSRHSRWREESPPFPVLLVTASIVLAIQIIGLVTLGATVLEVGPPSLAGSLAG